MRLSELRAKYPRIAISGAPRTGKSTLSKKFSDRFVVHTDDFMRLAWENQPEAVIGACSAKQLCVEGCQVARSLRKGLKVDAVIWCRAPVVAQTPKQKAMGRGVEKVFREWRERNGSVPVIPIEEIEDETMATQTNEPSQRRQALGAIDEQTRSVEIVASTTNPGLTYVWEPDGNGGGQSVEYWDSIVGWDLERFSKNAKILWSHNSGSLPIGWAEDVVWDDAKKELRMRARFATERESPAYGDSPGAENVWRSVVAKLITALSVGFRTKSIVKVTEKDGKKYRDVTAELTEVSFVSVGEDEDALTEDARQTRSLKLDAGEVAHFDVSRLAEAKNIKRTQVGGIRIPARLARVGVLEYRPFGSAPRRELRSPEEVADPESLATLNGAPVIDFVDHVALVTPEDFRGKAIGHVENVHMDGDFVVGELVINDADAIAKIDAGERADVSAGYRSKDKLTPGTWRGQQYDRAQSKIRYNHVALCPPNRGRSGPEVGLRLDSNDAICVINEETRTMKVIKLDGKEYDFGSDAHIEKIEQMHQAELAKKDDEIATANKAKDAAEAKFDAKEKAVKTADEEAAEKEKARACADEEAKKTAGAKMKKRLRLMLRFMRLMDDSDEDKMDAMSDRELMLTAIKKSDDKFNDEGRSDDYLEARFDALEVSNTSGVDAVVRNIESVKRSGVNAVDPVDKAQADMVKRNRDAWKTPAAS